MPLTADGHIYASFLGKSRAYEGCRNIAKKLQYLKALWRAQRLAGELTELLHWKDGIVTLARSVVSLLGSGR